MYLLLIIYSITNLNVVSWGTREVAVKKTKKELAEEKKTQENAVKKSKKDGGCLFTLFFCLFTICIYLFTFFVGIWGLLMNGSDEDEEGGVDFALGNVLRLMLFTKKKENSQERQQLIRIADSLDNLGKRLDHIEGVIGKYF